MKNEYGIKVIENVQDIWMKQICVLLLSQYKKETFKWYFTEAVRYMYVIFAIHE